MVGFLSTRLHYSNIGGFLSRFINMNGGCLGRYGSYSSAQISAALPYLYGVRAANLLDKTEHAEYASAMFFILNATSIQLIPTSIISVRMALGSAAPADIALPTLIATVFSTLLGAMLCRIFIPPKKAENTAFFLKRKGAGI